VVQEESNHAPSAVVDEASSSLINAAQRSQARGKGPAYGGKSNSKYCTYCHRNNHVVEFCYAKHGYPGVNRGSSSVNASTNDGGDTSNGNMLVDTSSNSPATTISQDKYDQLVALLQQVSLLPSVSTNPSVPSTNHVSTSLTQPPTSTDSPSGIACPLSCSLISHSNFWLLDSGATDHVCSSLHWFTSFYRIKPVHISLPNGTSVLVNFAGNITFSPFLHVTHVLYSPDFKLNLLSVAKLCNSLSCTVRFTPSNCLIQDLISKRTIGLGDQVDHLYHLQIDPAFFASQVKLPSVVNSVSSCSLHSQTIPNNALWHFRLGHVSHSRMSYMTQLYPSVSFDNKAVCDVCHFAKQKRLPFTLSTSIATSKFDLLHLDIWGPLAIPSVHGHRYFLTIVDDHTRFVWIILLKQKSEVAIKLQHFITLIENQYTTVPKIIRSDNGPEFSLSTFYSSKGIIHQRSCVETPQQNGRVERKHQHILNVGRALLYHSKLPKSFWSYALLHATFIINRVPTPVLGNMSPYQKFYDQLPDINSFKVFGSLCYASTLNAHRSKLDPRARKSVFLGYTIGFKGYVLLDFHTREVFISRHVSFHEHILPYPISSTNPYTPWDYFPSTSSASPSTPCPDIPCSASTPSPPPTSTPNVSSSTSPTPLPPLKHSACVKHKPAHLHDYVCNTVSHLPSVSSSNTQYPISNFVSYTSLSPSQHHYILNPNLMLRLVNMTVGI
jgi:hypothetical protein